MSHSIFKVLDMTNGHLLDQTKCNLPFEVVAIYENGLKRLQQNSNSSVPPSVNVKIRVRNKEDAGKGRHGIISLPKLNTRNWPKRVRLVNSAQTIMSFNLAMEPNSDNTKQKSNKRLFQMFRPGGCFNKHSDEDGYSYMPCTSTKLNIRSASGMEDDESTTVDTLVVKKRNFSSSYTNTLKSSKTFLGKCKPGGCLDPPFGEDKYTYEPTVEDVKPLQLPVIKRNLSQTDINIMDIKTKSATQDQEFNILYHSNPETNILENTETLLTYPTNLSSSNLKTKDSKNRKSSLRIQEELLELSSRLTNEFPEAYFIPSRNEKTKHGKSLDIYNNYEEKDPIVKEAYVNKDYILQSLTPSELLPDSLTITSKSCDEPLRGVIKEKEIDRKLNSISTLVLETKDFPNEMTSKDNIKTTSKLSSADLKIKENKFIQDKSSLNNNNIPLLIDKNFISNITETKNILDKNISRLNSTTEINANQETSRDSNYNKNSDRVDYIDSEDDPQIMLCNLNVSNQSPSNISITSKDQSNIPINNFESREENDIPENRKYTKTEITDIKQQAAIQSGENVIINSLNEEKSDNLDYEYLKNIKEQVQGDDKNISFENFYEPAKLLVQDLEFSDNDNRKKLLDDKNEKITEQIVDLHPFIPSENLQKVISSHSSGDKIISLNNSHSILTVPKNISVDLKDHSLSTESYRLTDPKNNTSKHNDKQNKSVDSLENTLTQSLISGNISLQKTEINTKNDGPITLISQKDSPDTTKDTDIILLPELSQLNRYSLNKNDLDSQNETKSQIMLSPIMSQIKNSKDTIVSIKSSTQFFQKLTDFDSLQYHKSDSIDQKDDTNFNPLVTESELLMANQKSDIYNISEKDVISDDKFHDSDNELTTVFYQESEGGDKLESKESTSLSKNVDNSYSPENFELEKHSITEKQHFYQVPNKSKPDIQISEKKSSLKLENIRGLKIVDLITELDKSLTDSKDNIKSLSSRAINFGFHISTDENRDSSIKTFDPSTVISNYPQDKILRTKTIRKNNSGSKVQIDPDTESTMQIKPTRQINGSKKLAPNVLSDFGNDKKRNDIRVHSSETLINKDKLLQETLKAVYETLIPIEKIIMKLKEETDSLYREQILLKELLFSYNKDGIKINKIIPNSKTCRCLLREIGLE